MTPRAPKYCSDPTCNELVPAGVRCCPTHDTGRWRTKNTPKSRSAEGKWKKTRRAVLTRDGYQCKIRYVGICIGLASEVDHLIPVSEGGTDLLPNLRAACRPCHLAKSSDEGHTAAGHRPAARITYIPGELKGLP